MILWAIISGIAALSLILAYTSLRNDMKKGRHTQEVKKDLEKERVIFYAPAHKEKVQQEKN